MSPHHPEDLVEEETDTTATAPQAPADRGLPVGTGRSLEIFVAVVAGEQVRLETQTARARAATAWRRPLQGRASHMPAEAVEPRLTLELVPQVELAAAVLVDRMA